MKPYAERFYKSQEWKKTAKAYAKSKQNLCELCREQGRITPGEMVHHKIFLTEENISDPAVALNWDNLQLLCREHHAAVHHGTHPKRFYIDENGRVIPNGL